MAGERRINFGADATDAQYRTGDDTANNRFIVAEDLDGGTVLLEWDETAGEFVSRGPVNMSGNDLSNVGSLNATSLSTGQVDSLGGSTDAGSGAVRLANNTRVAWRDPSDSNDGYILYDDAGNFLIQTGNEFSEGVRVNSPDSANINTNALESFETLMTLDDGNNDAILLASAGGTSGTLNLGSYSTRRLKSNISSWSDTTLFDISPKTYTKGDGGPENLGIIAEELHDAGLTHLVQYASLDDAWDDDDDTTLTDEYLSQYAVEREYQGETQTVVPDNVDLDAVVAAQQSLIRDLQDRVETLESQ